MIQAKSVRTGQVATWESYEALNAFDGFVVTLCGLLGELNTFTAPWPYPPQHFRDIK
jgi:hypothetical protein